MAEAVAAIGVVASVAQLADYGFKLSIKLFAYSEAVYKADKTIRSFANEVSLTSAVLKELAAIFESKESSFVSNRAVKATEATVNECFEVFNQLNAILKKSMGSSFVGRGSNGALKDADSAGAGAKMGTFERLKWPFLQPKVDLLRSNLDRMKTSLTLMLQVLSFARDLAKQSKEPPSTVMQKQMIESLARSEIEATNRYNKLLRLLEHQEHSASQSVGDGTREIEDMPSEDPPPYINATTIPTHSNAIQTNSTAPLMAKLPLCFEIINEVLEQTTRDGPPMSAEPAKIERYVNHIDLMRTIQASKTKEAQLLVNLLGSPARRIFANAAIDKAVLSQMLDQLAVRYPQFVDTTVSSQPQVQPYSLQEGPAITQASGSSTYSTSTRFAEAYAHLYAQDGPAQRTPLRSAGLEWPERPAARPGSLEQRSRRRSRRTDDTENIDSSHSQFLDSPPRHPKAVKQPIGSGASEAWLSKELRTKPKETYLAGISDDDGGEEKRTKKGRKGPQRLSLSAGDDTQRYAAKLDAEVELAELEAETELAEAQAGVNLAIGSRTVWSLEYAGDEAEDNEYNQEEQREDSTKSVVADEGYGFVDQDGGNDGDADDDDEVYDSLIVSDNKRESRATDDKKASEPTWTSLPTTVDEPVPKLARPSFESSVGDMLAGGDMASKLLAEWTTTIPRTAVGV